MINVPKTPRLTEVFKKADHRVSAEGVKYFRIKSPI